MNTAGKLAAYGVVTALVAGGGWAVGTAVGPLAGAEPAAGVHGGEDAGHGDAHSGTVAGAAQPDQPAGLVSSRGGYTLTPTSTTLTPGATENFAFQITGPAGTPVTRFDVEHEKRMHLILVRRDTSGFQHLHPRMDAGGTWTVPLTVRRPGTYRVFADFTPSGGTGLTLGTDLFAPGPFAPQPHGPARVANVGGYQVRLDGDLVPGKTSEVTLTVTRDGTEVTDLQPYLGAYGHLVALRQGDLAYLHVHPHGEPGDGSTTPGPRITFSAEVPTAGTYRLFLDFKHGNTVRTADFTVQAGRAATPGQATPPPATGDGHGHGDAGKDEHE